MASNAAAATQGALVHSPGQATEWCWHHVWCPYSVTLGSQAAVVGLGMHWADLFGHCTGFGGMCVLRACTDLWLKTARMGNAWVAMAMRARHWCSLCPGACAGV